MVVHKAYALSSYASQWAMINSSPSLNVRLEIGDMQLKTVLKHICHVYVEYLW